MTYGRSPTPGPQRHRLFGDRSGREPRNARSPLGLRRVLAWVAVVAGTAIAVVFAVIAATTTGSPNRSASITAAAIGAVVAVIGAINVAVLHGRR